MAKMIELSQKTLRVLIAPDNGGMVAQIYIENVSVLKLDESTLDIAPMNSGGCPVLFPFAGRVSNDSYEWNGNTYTMPVHGLVKNAPFAVRYQDGTKVILWRSSCQSEMSNYPFAYDLELEYRLMDETLYTIARIHNRSQVPLPHAMAWHPYFKSTQKDTLCFSHQMSIHYDYIKQQDAPAEHNLNLTAWYDDVFHTPVTPGFTLANSTDGYSVCCIPDDSFSVLVVCSWLDGAVCIEPWCGIPDSIKNGRFLQLIPPNQEQQLVVKWILKKEIT